ncbi:hypothetical protein NC652_006235 [Populus alba x Populus x berolinensis]|nr:hypothetical protein NC652_006235 [Populus alba x Populus x berolinensis]
MEPPCFPLNCSISALVASERGDAPLASMAQNESRNVVDIWVTASQETHIRFAKGKHGPPSQRKPK